MLCELLEKYGVNIVGLTDNAKERRLYDSGYDMPKPYIPSTELLTHRKEFDKIIIASRQSIPISKYLRGLGFQEDDYIVLPI